MTEEKHKAEADGYLGDGVSHYPADQQKLNTYKDASIALSRFQAPVLIHSDNPNERLFIAAFDGTGNDKRTDPNHATNVAKIADDVTVLSDNGNRQIRVGYVAGPGTPKPGSQKTDAASNLDAMTGGTYNQRTEEMYKLFIKQAAAWKTENPNMKISVADIGFSRGAEQAAGFSRLVQERGIQDPDGAKYSYGSNGLISKVTYDKPPLVKPGETAQAVGLFDPVGTGKPVWLEDRRLPPSVISGFQIIADDERRGLFKSDHIIKPGATPDGRFLAVNVAGAHSDVGGSYHRDGLAVRSNNLMSDYLNGLSDKPFLEKRAESNDPRLNVIHRSDEGNMLYTLTPKINRLEPGGYNERLAPKIHFSRVVGDRNDAEPRNELLSKQFERQPVKIGAVPLTPEQAKAAQTSGLSSQLDRMLAAGKSGDHSALRAETQALANAAPARAMQAQAVDTVNRQEQAAAQKTPPQALPQQPPQQMPPQQPNPVIGGPHQH